LSFCNISFFVNIFRVTELRSFGKRPSAQQHNTRMTPDWWWWWWWWCDCNCACNYLPHSYSI